MFSVNLWLSCWQITVITVWEVVSVGCDGWWSNRTVRTIQRRCFPFIPPKSQSRFTFHIREDRLEDSRDRRMQFKYKYLDATCSEFTISPYTFSTTNYFRNKKLKAFTNCKRSSVQFSHSVMSNPLWPHGLQHTRPPCSSLTPGVCSNSCPLSRWCHPTILCRPLLLPPSIFPSIRVFSNESALCIRGPKYWKFTFNISPSNEYSGLISFRMDWLDLLAVQRTLKSQNSSKLVYMHKIKNGRNNPFQITFSNTLP